MNTLIPISYDNPERPTVSGRGYTKNRKGKPFQHNSGRVQTPNTTVWTEAGQRFIYEQLKKNYGLVPTLERAEQTTFDRSCAPAGRLKN